MTPIKIQEELTNRFTQLYTRKGINQPKAGFCFNLATFGLK